uniref:Uncharacterized protein n=1 Tax=uncultured marine virus TaxID=186617 RepID=A0A0F7L3Q4_9VIRU|nr:hypothetical protein [uncultured marine virus]
MRISYFSLGAPGSTRHAANRLSRSRSGYSSTWTVTSRRLSLRRAWRRASAWCWKAPGRPKDSRR